MDEIGNKNKWEGMLCEKHLGNELNHSDRCDCLGIEDYVLMMGESCGLIKLQNSKMKYFSSL